MLAGVFGLAGVGHLGEVPAVLGVAQVLMEELETHAGRRAGGLRLDALQRQGAEEPQLPTLEGEELLPRRGQLAAPERLEVAAVAAVDGRGEVELDQAGLQDLPA